MLDLSHAEARALIAGEIIVAFADRGAVTEGDEMPVTATVTLDRGAIKPAYHRWIGADLPEGSWTGVVEAVEPAAILDPDAGWSRHLRTSAPGGDLVILRVYGDEGPVLTDAAYAARRKSVEGALRS